MTFVNPSLDSTVDRYTSRFNKYGYSPLSLGWTKGKQQIRFEILTSQVNLRGKRILDFGCGFGDLNITLQALYKNEYEYIGIDIVPCLLDQAQKIYTNQNITFMESDLLSFDYHKPVDYVISSGVFNHRFEDFKEEDHYNFIFQNLKQAMKISSLGFAFDFLSDKVDYKLNHTFHSNPSIVLDMSFNITRNLNLRNDYMPFEFAIFGLKNDCFDPADTLFSTYKHKIASK